MQTRFDVIIIGAGTAGLAAAKAVRRQTQNFLLLDHGPLGTTCARVGCMPSKALIEMAHQVHLARSLQKSGIIPDQGPIHGSKIFARVRELRDHFVGPIVRGMDSWGEHFRQGHARFTGPNTILLDDRTHLEAKSIIIATGSRPILPAQWPQKHPGIVTTDDFFELERIPSRWGIIGLGPIGLELGQALAFLGCEVHGFSKDKTLGGLEGSELNDAACSVFAQDMKLKLGSSVEVTERDGQLEIHVDSQHHPMDAILVAIGRQPNLEGLDLANTGCSFDAKGRPITDDRTLALKGSNIYMAGDVDARKTILHEAADDGFIAAYNACRDQPWDSERRTPLGIVFTHPGIATVGRRGAEGESTVIGRVSYEDQGRARLMGANQGAVHIHVNALDGRILGADLLAPDAEHLAHLLAWSIQSRLTVHDMLRLPFYHPTLEEGLRTALRDAARQMPKTDQSALGV